MPRLRTYFMAVVALLLFATACGSGEANRVDALPDVELEPSREFVHAAAARSTTSSYRLEASMSMHMKLEGLMEMDLPGDEPLLSGVFDGQNMSVVADLGAMFEEMADSNPMLAGEFDEMMAYRDQLRIEMVMAGTDLYVHAPMFAVPEFGTLDPAMAALASGWGRVDLNRVGGFDMSGLNALGTGNIDPSTIFELLDSIGAQVRDDGNETVRGVQTTRLLAPVSLASLLEAQGSGGQMLGADAMMDDAVDAMADATADITINIDSQGLVRRIAFEFDLGQALQGAMSDDIGAAMFGELEMSFGLQMDMFDYGHDQPVSIPTDAADVTNSFSDFSSFGA